MNSNKLLAHDLNKSIWRSEDINVSTYVKPSHGQVEIKTPFHQTSNIADYKDSFVFQNSTKNTTFSLIKINEKIVEDLKRCGFVWPSPIQTTCIPLGRLGIDLIAQSKSGTGKTIVFVVCALEMVIQDLDNKVPCPKVLILAPTREIAVQIADIIKSITVNWKNFSCYKAIGGTKVSENIEKLFVSQIVVGTPGRICCLLEMDYLKPHSIRLFILDECDKLMEENFKKQIDKIYNCLPLNKQMIVTSATLSTEMISYLSKYMLDAALIRLDADKPTLIGVMQYVLVVEGHCLDYLNFESKIDSLLYLLKNVHFMQCFIFLNYQTRVKYLYERLNSEGMSVTYITGDMSQKERLQAIELFRMQRFKIFISTDLTSRGIDIESVNLVINVDVPFNCETYLHRIGRSGRFGSSGIAITIVGKNDEHQKFNSLISQYNLQIKELNLPLTVDLWEVFYQERSENNPSHSQNSMKLNPVFEKIESLYEKLVNNQTELVENIKFRDYSMNFDDIIAQENFEEFLANISEELRLFSNKLFISEKENDSQTLSSHFKNLDHNEQELENVLKWQEKNKTPRSFENQSSLKDAKTEKTSRENNLDISSLNNIAKHSITYQKRLAFIPSTVNNLFRQAFLNPFVSKRSVFTNFPLTPSTSHQNHNNLIICRYLLKGGKFD